MHDVRGTRFPSLGLSGSSIQRLYDDTCDALTKLQSAIDAIRTIEPNRRDFIGRDSDYDAALLMHHAWRLKLTVTHSEVTELAAHLADRLA